MEANHTNWTEIQVSCLDCFSLIFTSKDEKIENEFCDVGNCSRYFGNTGKIELMKR